MLTEELIRQLAQQALTRDDLYVVEVNVANGNRITVYVGSDDVVTIDDCAEISRYIESNLDRETEDFEMEVSSPGLSNPLRVARQYKKLIGQNLEMILHGQQKKTRGKLLSASDTEIELQVVELQKVEGEKRKKEVLTNNTIPYSEIKIAKLEISFK